MTLTPACCCASCCERKDATSTWPSNPTALERVIVVTGLNVEDIRKLFPTVCHALSKPVIPKRLFESIHQCLRSSSYEQFTGQ
jgi:hypothetical protein